MPVQLVIGDKRYSSWSLRAALALELTGAVYSERMVWLNKPGSKQKMLEHSAAAKVPVLKIEDGGRPLVIADSLAIIEYLAERFPAARLWPTDNVARAIARSACAQMHSGFAALRTHLPMDLQRDASLSAVPLEALADIQRIIAIWAECRTLATESGPYLFGRLSAADAYFAPVAVRLRGYRVELPAEAAAYVEAIYQWPAFMAWRQAALEEKNS